MVTQKILLLSFSTDHKIVISPFLDNFLLHQNEVQHCYLDFWVA